MMIKRIMLLLLACCVVYVSSQEADAQKIEWRRIKADFSNLEDFYHSAEVGFKKYFKRYSPQVISKSGERLIMKAKYGKYDIICTFYLGEDSQYIVSIDTKFDRDRIKWIENVVKQTEKQRK